MKTLGRKKKEEHINMQGDGDEFKEVDLNQISLSETQKKYIDRKKRFNKQFELTLQNFSANIDFLNI